MTAAKYLNALAAGEILQKQKFGKANVYINRRLTDILIGDDA